MNETIHFSLKREKEVYDLVANSLDGRRDGMPYTIGNLLGDNPDEYDHFLSTSEEILGIFHGILRASGHIHGGLARLDEEELSTIKKKIVPETSVTEGLLTPVKRKSGVKMRAAAKENNRQINRLRSVVERAIEQV